MLQSQQTKKIPSQTVYESGFIKHSPAEHRKQANARQNSAVGAEQKLKISKLSSQQVLSYNNSVLASSSSLNAQ